MKPNIDLWDPYLVYYNHILCIRYNFKSYKYIPKYWKYVINVLYIFLLVKKYKGSLFIFGSFDNIDVISQRKTQYFFKKYIFTIRFLPWKWESLCTVMQIDICVGITFLQITRKLYLIISLICFKYWALSECDKNKDGFFSHFLHLISSNLSNLLKYCI